MPQKKRARYYLAFEYRGTADHRVKKPGICPEPYCPGELAAFYSWQERDLWVGDNPEKRTVVTRKALPAGWYPQDIQDAVDYIEEREIHKAWTEGNKDKVKKLREQQEETLNGTRSRVFTHIHMPGSARQTGN